MSVMAIKLLEDSADGAWFRLKMSFSERKVYPLE